MATVTRKAAWRNGSTNGWHDDLVWYAAAIHRMKAATPRLNELQAIIVIAILEQRGRFTNAQVEAARSITRGWSDPKSLGYQAQVHAAFLPQSSWPSHGGHTVTWHQCAHNHWFFVPWHRAFLLEFEAVARAHIGDLGGPAETWGLPYWNYSDYLGTPEALGLPLPFRGATLPSGVDVPGVEPDADGSVPNPLFDPTRLMTGDPNASGVPGAEHWADASDALTRPHFAVRQDTGLVSFGGGYLEDTAPTNFHRSNEPGMLDQQPHGSVHMQVHGSMAIFLTAGLDPVFWAHHANVDRLWETYARDLGHGYPFSPRPAASSPPQQSWESQPFRFLRPDGEVAEWTAATVIDIAALGYAYDSITAPQLLPTPGGPPSGSQEDPFGFAEEAAAPEPVAAALHVPLARTADAQLSGADPNAGEFGFAADVPEGGRWLLRLDGIRALSPAPTSYQVYLGLGPGAPADPSNRAHYVGLLSLFGVYEATLDDGTSAASGQLRVFDVTDQVRQLGPDFDPLHPTVRFVPLNPDRDLEGAEMSIERVTLEVT